MTTDEVEDGTARTYTVDELAEASGMTVRNIRAHQSRGLLPGPKMRGRVGFYDDHHLRRLQAIRSMQDEGLNLVAIGRALKDERLSLALSRPIAEVEPPMVMSQDELITKFWPRGGDPERMTEATLRAVEFGIISFDGVEPGQVRVERPQLIRLAVRMVEFGLPADVQMEMHQAAVAATDEVVAAYVRMAESYVVPAVASESDGDVTRIQEAVDEIRRNAADGLMLLFDHQMAVELSEAFPAFDTDLDEVDGDDDDDEDDAAG